MVVKSTSYDAAKASGAPRCGKVDPVVRYRGASPFSKGKP
jgi:hypothetical protein